MPEYFSEPVFFKRPAKVFKGYCLKLSKLSLLPPFLPLLKGGAGGRGGWWLGEGVSAVCAGAAACSDVEEPIVPITTFSDFSLVA